MKEVDTRRPWDIVLAVELLALGVGGAREAIDVKVSKLLINTCTVMC